MCLHTRLYVLQLVMEGSGWVGGWVWVCFRSENKVGIQQIREEANSSSIQTQLERKEHHGLWYNRFFVVMHHLARPKERLPQIQLSVKNFECSFHTSSSSEKRHCLVCARVTPGFTPYLCQSTTGCDVNEPPHRSACLLRPTPVIQTTRLFAQENERRNKVDLVSQNV